MFPLPTQWVLKRLVWLLVLGGILTPIGFFLGSWYQDREAISSLQLCRFAEAYGHYTKELKLWPWSASLHFHAARAARRAELYSEAEHHLAEYQRLQGDSAEATLPLALERLLLQAQTGDLAAVEIPLWQYVEQDKPEASLVLEALARGYSRQLRPSNAMRCWERILEREPDNIEALAQSGETIRKASVMDLAVAVKFCRRALELDPERVDARLGLGQILLRFTPDESRSHFEYILARQPDNVTAMLGLGIALRSLSEPQKAREVLEAVLAKEPANTEALSELGRIALMEGSLQEAETLLRKAIASEPANREAIFRLHQCLSQQPGKEDEAAELRAAYDRVQKDLARLSTIISREMAESPHDPRLHYEVASFYMRYGQPKLALRWLHSALKLDPDHQPSRQALYEYYERTGDLEKAERHRSQLR
jgi:tetratricopeptide (TPR) repeat protein